MAMKGMILAAGYGTRMGPISNYLAKPAVPFLGVPMIEHSIAVLRSGGIEDIIINLHHLPETVTKLLGDGSRLGVNLKYSFEDPILGSGGGIGKAREFFGNETFVVLNSDVMIDADISEVISAHKAGEADATLLLRKDPTGNYGKVTVDETDCVRKIESYPKELDFHGGIDYMFAGLHVIEPVWFEYTPDKEIYESFPEVYGPMILAGKRVEAYIYDGRWIDIGSARRYLDATLDQLVGNLIPNTCRIPPDSLVKHSVLTGRTTVESNCRLDGVIALGEASIASGCVLNRCILCPGAEVPEGTEANEVVFHEKTFTLLRELKE